MRTFPGRKAPILAALVAAGLAAATPASSAEETVTTQQVEAARRCAIETRVASRAFGDVSASVQAGASSRTTALLATAEESLASARRACAGDPDVLVDLDLLERDVQALRRSLGTSSR